MRPMQGRIFFVVVFGGFRENDYLCTVGKI